mmetsp:Transcript_24793/g.37683  ORF Transcript_24793/g.37683 Transcript_24793/m.37683 type:complete len:116 (+) Transcript_24793:801-1148(+)
MVLIELKSIKPIYSEERAAVTSLTLNTYDVEPAAAKVDKAVEDHFIQSLVDTLLKQGVPYETVMSTVRAMGAAGKKRNYNESAEDDGDMMVDFGDDDNSHFDKRSFRINFRSNEE